MEKKNLALTGAALALTGVDEPWEASVAINRPDARSDGPRLDVGSIDFRDQKIEAASDRAGTVRGFRVVFDPSRLGGSPIWGAKPPFCSGFVTQNILQRTSAASRGE
jgi:hypothetical protein